MLVEGCTVCVSSTGAVEKYEHFLAIILELFIYFIARRKFHCDFYISSNGSSRSAHHILGQVVCVGRFKMGLSH